MAYEQLNIVVFCRDNFGWDERGCYGGGVPRAPTLRIDNPVEGAAVLEAA